MRMCFLVVLDRKETVFAMLDFKMRKKELKVLRHHEILRKYLVNILGE